MEKQGLTQVRASVGVGASGGGGVWPARIVTQGKEEPSSAHCSPDVSSLRTTGGKGHSSVSDARSDYEDR